MSTKSGPLKLTAIVFSAKGLKSKKKDKHKFSVIIGVGQHNKFRTDIVEDLFGNPAFNTECEIVVDDPSLPLTFLVTEKHDKDILGQVIVPLQDLVTFRTNRPVRAVLQPHKKCPRAEGEITYEAWISSGSPVGPTTAAEHQIDVDDHRVSLPSGLRKLRDKLSHSPMLTRKSSGSSKGHQRTNSDGLFPLKPQASVSCHDLTSLSSYGTSPAAAESFKSPRLSIVSGADSDSISSIDISSPPQPVESLKPEVTGISPKEGPTEGGTKLTIRGSNLGCNKDDVVGLYVCGSNVLSTLEYFSPSKLVCTTKSHRPCAGTIAVETQSGGRGVSLVQFTFIAVATAVDGASDTASEASSSISRSSSRGDADLKRESSLKGHSDHDAGTTTLLASNIKARSMFDLSLPALSVKHVAAPRPEVTGVSPCDGPSRASTKITIRGSNLGRSKSDIVSLSVAGIDCTSSVEYESPSRLVCLAGPSTGGVTSGDIIVETKSGGVGVSTVQFRYVDVVDEEEQWAAVPYDVTSDDISTTTVTAEEIHNNSPVPTITGQSRQFSMQPTSVYKQPPPVVEIQPMSRSDRRVPSSPHRKGQAPPTPSQRVNELNGTGTNRREKGDADSQAHVENVNKSVAAPVDRSLNDKIAELTNNLLTSEDQVKRLQLENRALREENERMRQYMECLVSKAITNCPQILCVDTSKFL